MRFSAALAHFENGGLIARVRWNKDIADGQKNIEVLSFVYQAQTNENSPMPQAMIDSGEYASEEAVTVLTHPMKKNRANLHSIWLPTVEDMCAKDWYVIDFKRDWQSVCGVFNRSNNKNQKREENNDATETTE